jgi:uncharacterized protein with HEPN domain
MRTEILYLTDIVEAADAIARFLHDVEQDRFLNDELRQSAVLQKLIVIGEAASHISSVLRDRHPEVKWRGAIGLRNISAHEYFSLNWEVVWITATLDVPMLREQIQAILDEMAGGQVQAGLQPSG